VRLRQDRCAIDPDVILDIEREEEMKAWKFAVAIAALLVGAGTAAAQEILDAVKSGDLAKAKTIVEKDPSLVRTKDKVGNTPLHVAAIAGSAPMIEWLLSKGADVDASNTEAMTPLFEAIRNGKDEAARVLIEKGARTDGALQRAAMKNRTAVMELLIARGVDIEAQDSQGYTPLTMVTRISGPFEALELLVRKGANINLPDSLGNTPLDNAILYANADDRAIDLLLARSPETTRTPRYLTWLLSAAARRGHVRLFEYYRQRGGDVLIADEATRRDVMRSAIIGGSLEMVRTLQSRGIPLVLSANQNGATPVHSLASNPNAVDMIELLVRNGADLNARTNNGRSAYNIAEEAGNRDVVALLLKLGASPEPQKFPRLSGPYLGQTPPGDELKLFAPGIVFLDHGTVSASPDGQEMYWPTGTAIMTTKVQDGRWTQPAFAPFSGPSEINFYDDVPFVTPDNKRLFFTSKRPLASATSQKENICSSSGRRRGGPSPGRLVPPSTPCRCTGRWRCPTRGPCTSVDATRRTASARPTSTRPGWSMVSTRRRSIWGRPSTPRMASRSPSSLPTNPSSSSIERLDRSLRPS
jgi:ankyrin repeat protein